MKLYCVRHGETTFNFEGRIQGQLDSQLSPLGIRQCQAVAAALSALDIDAVVASPLRRALDTAECIAQRLSRSVTLEPRLVEINAGIFQGHCWQEIGQRFPDDAVRWRSQDPDYRIPQGESRRDLMARAREAFIAMREAGYRNVVVVAHGGSLSAAFKSLLEVPAERNPFELRNGSISTVVWEKEFKLLTLNETAHLGDAMSGGGDL